MERRKPVVKASYKPYRAFRQRVRNLEYRFACPDCRASNGNVIDVSPKDYENHCTLVHGFDASAGCVWCKQYFWIKRTKHEHWDHLNACAVRFLRAIVDFTTDAPANPPLSNPPSNKSDGLSEAPSPLLLHDPPSPFVHPPTPEETPVENRQDPSFAKPANETMRVTDEEEIRVLRQKIDESRRRTQQSEECELWKELHRLQQEKRIQLYEELRQVYLTEIATVKSENANIVRAYGELGRNVEDGNEKILRLVATMKRLKAAFASCRAETDRLRIENERLKRSAVIVENADSSCEIGNENLED